MTEDETCAVCGAPLLRGPRSAAGDPHGDRPGPLSCPHGHTRARDYPQAEDARREGRSWSPSEPSHCRVAMTGNTIEVRTINGRPMLTWSCQVCSAALSVPQLEDASEGVVDCPGHEWDRDDVHLAVEDAQVTLECTACGAVLIQPASSPAP